MRAPAYTKALIERRNAGDHPTDVFISLGWPSEWLRVYVAKSPLTRGAVILACIENDHFDFSALRGLSVCLWIERTEEQARANKIAASIMAHSPLRCFVVNAVTGAMTWHRAEADWKVAA
jgi:hypothetical protein